jgi:predicted permease
MLARFLAFVRGILRRRAIDAELDEELAFHVESETRAHIARGVPAEEARRLAVLGLGGLIQTRDAVRDVRTTWLESAWREARQGIRALWAAPAFTVPAVLVVALGIGGTTAVFSVLDGVLLKRLPYPDAGELVRVWSRNDERKIPFLSVSPADFEDWTLRASAPRRFGAYTRPRVLALRGSGEPVTVMAVTPGLFPTLGVAPTIGRWLVDEDGIGTAAVISHEMWQRHFGGAIDVIGRSLTTDGEAWTVVGVMPSGFDVPIAPADAWVPIDTAVDGQFAHTLRVVARAARGVDAAAAVARDLEGVSSQLAAERPDTNRGWSVTVLPLFDVVVSPEFARSLWIVAAAVLFLLVMASTSAAGLLLTRASGRSRELAVRTALGASRGSVVRLLLMESLVLGVLSGIGGLLLASWGLALLQSAGGATVPRLGEVTLSGRVFVVAAGATLLSALAAGLLPAWKSTRGLPDSLRSRGAELPPASARTLHGLVVLEVATAVLLVVGAALLVQTVLNLQQRRLGFDSDGVMAIQAIWPASEQVDLVGPTEEALSKVAALPGVSSAAAVSAPPFSGSNSGNTFQIEGLHTAGMPLPDADYRVVSPGYFRTLGIAVRGGRDFEPSDGGGPGAVIVSETAARRYWPKGDALGRRLKLGRTDWLSVVGIVGDARYLALEDPSDEVRPMLYVPHREMPETPMTVVLRASVAPASLTAVLRRTLTEDAGLSLTRIDTMDGMLREASVSQRFTMSLVTAFAVTAVGIAVAGLYGLLAYLIARRTKEIGVRVALGARHWDIVRSVAGRTLAIVAAGVAAGLAVSVALGDTVRSVLFGVSPHDPATYAGVAAGFLALALLAGLLPTLRALRIDPVRVIRAE